MRIFWFGDLVVQSGFGRIGNEICLRLAQRGHEISGASTLWDGVMPINAPERTPFLHAYPFQVFGLAGRDLWQYGANLINLKNPDIVVCCQDFPYAQTLFYSCRLDWSRRALAVVTPIDGTPIHSDWLNLVDDVDATMVISKFGVEAMRDAGKQVSLCHPGVDTKVFHPAAATERAALREKAGLAPDAFILGMAAMNQGRKAIPHTVEGFWEFAKDKPNAFLYLDMDKVSAAGWDIPKLAKTVGIPDGRILYKEDWLKRGLNELRDRFVCMDAHSVMSHREGFGLPLLESMACRVPTLAMDWCSGTEIVGDGHGYLVKRDAHHRFSTWGNAQDYDPDLNDFVAHLNNIYAHPLQAQGVADVGYEWAKLQTWDNAATQVENVLLQVYSERQKRNAGTVTTSAGVTAPVSVSGNSGVQSTSVRAEVVQEHHAESATVLEGNNPS